MHLHEAVTIKSTYQLQLWNSSHLNIETFLFLSIFGIDFDFEELTEIFFDRNLNNDNQMKVIWLIDAQPNSLGTSRFNISSKSWFFLFNSHQISFHRSISH